MPRARWVQVEPPDLPRLPMKTFLIAGRALLILILLFLPSIGVLLVAGFLTGSTWWFGFLGLPALLANGTALLVKPVRRKVWLWAGGKPAVVRKPA